MISITACQKVKAPVWELALCLDKPLSACRVETQNLFVSAFGLTISLCVGTIFHLLIRNQVHRDLLFSDRKSRGQLYA
ncbi:MAG: hypothetical protein AAB401_09485 [Acidobacteriota bacterium]